MDNLYSNSSDEELALRVQKGDTDVFGVLISRYQKKLLSYGKRFLSNSDNIEDVVQDVFIKTYQNIQSFDTSLKFSSWIYRIAHNTYVNALKKQSRYPVSLFDFDTFLSYTVVDNPIEREREQKEIKVVVDKGLDKVSPVYREILVLYYIEDLSYKEISDILHIPIGTVGIRLKRAKEMLRKVIDKNTDNNKIFDTQK